MCDLRIPINYRLQDLAIFMHFSCNLGQDTPETSRGSQPPSENLEIHLAMINVRMVPRKLC